MLARFRCSPVSVTRKDGAPFSLLPSVARRSVGLRTEPRVETIGGTGRCARVMPLTERGLGEDCTRRASMSVRVGTALVVLVAAGITLAASTNGCRHERS